MHIKKISFLLFSFFTAFLYPQSGWQLVTTFPAQISGIAFSDSTTGFAGIGAYAENPPRLIKTLNGGTTWEPLPVPVLTGAIRQIRFFNPAFGISVGDSGTVITTENGGESWSVRNIGTDDLLMAVCANPSGNIFAASRTHIYRSTDRGVSWTQTQTSIAPPHSVWGIAFADTITGYAVGTYGATYKTTDGGSSWVSVPPLVPDVSMFGILFNDSPRGVCLGGGSIAKTTDGGLTWKQKYSGMSQLNSVSAYDNAHIWAAGSDRILYSSNGGNSWTEQPFSPYHYLMEIYCANKKICFAIGAEGALYRREWQWFPVDSREPFEAENLNETALHQNYPNPFNPLTTIRFTLSQNMNIRLSLYDMLGSEAAVLAEGMKERGGHSIIINGSSFAAGMYVCTLTAGNQRMSRKVTLLK